MSECSLVVMLLRGIEGSSVEAARTVLEDDPFEKAGCSLEIAGDLQRL